MGRMYPKARVPQVIVLEREVDNQITAVHVGPEHELARYVGITEIWNWARQNASLGQRSGDGSAKCHLLVGLHRAQSNPNRSPLSRR